MWYRHCKAFKQSVSVTPNIFLSFNTGKVALTYVVQVEGQILVLKKGVIGKAGALDLLEEGADIPAVEDIQQHDTGNTQTHIEHSLYAVLHCHGFSLSSDPKAELTTKT